MSRLPGVVIHKGLVQVLGIWLQVLTIFSISGVQVGAATTSASGSQKSTNSSNPSPNLIELAQGWRLISADKVAGAESAVSSAGFDTSK